MSMTGGEVVGTLKEKEEKEEKRVQERTQTHEWCQGQNNRTSDSHQRGTLLRWRAQGGDFRWLYNDFIAFSVQE